jgi:hypothetical protein
MEAKHLISDIGDHLSRIGWVNSLRVLRMVMMGS